MMQCNEKSLCGKTIMIGAGGTGGHVYPALALAETLLAKGAKVHWLGTAAGIESKLVTPKNMPLHLLSVTGLRGKKISVLLKAPFILLKAFMQARRHLKQASPNLYIGFGGFASGPGALAAKWLSIPVVIHEQNAAMGLTNRWVSKWAKRVLLAFPITGSKGQVVGNPVRRQIVEKSQLSKSAGKEKCTRILIVGGSLGAKAINEVVPTVVSRLRNNKALGDIEVRHQTGETTFLDTQADYERLGILDQVSCTAYIDDMASAYADADLIIARAGALTVSEIASAGRAAIFVPLPHAVDNHQYLNAKFLETAGAAILMPQQQLTVDNLLNTIMTLINENQLPMMAEKALSQSHANALPAMIDIIEEVLNEHS